MINFFFFIKKNIVDSIKITFKIINCLDQHLYAPVFENTSLAIEQQFQHNKCGSAQMTFSRLIGTKIYISLISLIHPSAQAMVLFYP